MNEIVAVLLASTIMNENPGMGVWWWRGEGAPTTRLIYRDANVIDIEFKCPEGKALATQKGSQQGDVEIKCVAMVPVS